jgi:hypothetical protein
MDSIAARIKRLLMYPGVLMLIMDPDITNCDIRIIFQCMIFIRSAYYRDVCAVHRLAEETLEELPSEDLSTVGGKICSR